MDYIINKLNSRIILNEKGSLERQTLLRERIEYVLYMLLGCLWNEYIYDVNIEKGQIAKISEIVKKLHKMTIGDVVSAIRELDPYHKFVSDKDLKIMGKYPHLRNDVIGHGYVHDDQASEVEKEMEELYQDFSQMEFLSKKYDIVCVTSIRDDKYNGYRLDINTGSNDPKVWACAKETLGDGFQIPSVFLFDEDRHYYRVTPFVFIEDTGESVYVFRSLEDKLSGRVKMNQLFRSRKSEFHFQELISISYESECRRISSNGTVMNYFDKNYGTFIDTPIEKKINDFLSPKSKAYVQATIWGHGGVGKTACIQNICMNKFNGKNREFSYIIFTSAKDREYDPQTGKINEIDGLRSYEEVINTIFSVIFDEDTEEDTETKEEKIKTISSRVLLVIDDYETFPDEEKKKIQSFIGDLNTDYFKVVITTRNKRLSTGEEIPSGEFGLEDTRYFLLKIIENEYPGHMDAINAIINDSKKMDAIQQATSGRAIFIYQFAYIFVQTGFDVNYLTELKDSKNAQEFLYGRILSYLSDCARIAFACISQIAEEDNLIFNKRIIEYLLNDFDMDEISGSLQELIDQKIIEPYTDKNYRVYTKELFSLMQEKYDETDSDFREKIKSKLQDIGGTNVSGSVYEAMLNEANQCRGKRKEELYEKLLNEKDCEQYIKKSALTKWTSYVDNVEEDLDRAIRIYDTYIKTCSFQNDVEIVRRYAMLLWRVKDTGHKKACDILDRYFCDEANKKTADDNLELFALSVWYISAYAMENPPENMENPPENMENPPENMENPSENMMKDGEKLRIFQNYGWLLYNCIKDKDFSEFDDGVRNNVQQAFIFTADLGIYLVNNRYPQKAKFVRDIVRFGQKNFIGPAIDKLNDKLKDLEDAEKELKYEVGTIVQAKVRFVLDYGVLVRFKYVNKALVHQSQMPPDMKEKFKSRFKPGDTVLVRILEIDDKGYRLSMIDTDSGPVSQS